MHHEIHLRFRHANNELIANNRNIKNKKHKTDREIKKKEKVNRKDYNWNKARRQSVTKIEYKAFTAF